MPNSQIISQDVVCIPCGISNAYLLGTEEGFVLVDSGTPGNEKKILRAVREHLGKNPTPCAIVLTHGHFDHSGSALQLATNGQAQPKAALQEAAENMRKH